MQSLHHTFIEELPMVKHQSLLHLRFSWIKRKHHDLDPVSPLFSRFWTMLFLFHALNTQYSRSRQRDPDASIWIKTRPYMLVPILLLFFSNLTVMAVHVNGDILEGKLQKKWKKAGLRECYPVSVTRILVIEPSCFLHRFWDLKASLLPTMSKPWSHQQQRCKENLLMETAKARQVSLTWK